MANVSKNELRTVTIFQDLSDEQLDWFLDHVTELRLPAGEVYVRPGDPADRMIVLLEGELQARLPNDAVFTTRAGAVSGVLPYSRMTTFPATGRAVQASRILSFPAALFDDLLRHIPELGKRLVSTMVDRTRAATRLAYFSGRRRERNSSKPRGRRVRSRLRALRRLSRNCGA